MPKNPKTKRITVDLPPELHKAAKIKAVEKDKPLAEIIREMLRLWIKGKSTDEIKREI